MNLKKSSLKKEAAAKGQPQPTAASGQVAPKAGLPASQAQLAAEASKAPTAAQKQEAEENAAAVKEIESALFALKFYPVAVNEKSKDEAIDKLAKAYNKGSETVRQLIIYMIHEALAASAELKVMHNLEYVKAKNPALDQAQLRVGVYRSMFNYNTSLEGMMEMIRFLGALGSEDSAKLLTYHFSRLCSAENEANHMLRAAILDALGESDSYYALKSLLEYARYCDNERTFQRIVGALADWDEKIDTLKIPEEEKKKLRENLQELMTKDHGGSHYG
jgi:hypothetical protein